MNSSHILKGCISIIIAEAAGIIGSVFTASSIPTWYATIVRPTFAPPNWIFGPVWTTLFALMGVAAYLVWRKGWEKREVKIALWVYATQLCLNVLWSIVFFGLHSPGWAFVEIVFLWIAIISTIITFYRVSKPAAYLLVPYIVWVSFAALLNYTIWTIN